jgi:hypothetical protein
MAFYLRKTTPSVVSDPSGVAIDSCHNAWQELLVRSKESQVHHHAIPAALAAIGCGHALRWANVLTTLPLSRSMAIDAA